MDLIFANEINEANTETEEKPKIIAPSKEYFRNFIDLQHTNILNEDFPHEKFLMLKFKGVGDNFIVNSKGSLCFKSIRSLEREVEIPLVAGEMRILNYFKGINAETKFNSRGTMRLWTDFGLFNVGQVPIDFRTVLKTDNLFSNVKAYALATYSGLNWELITRLQIRKGLSTRYSAAQKINYSSSSLWSGLYLDFDLASLNLTQYNGLLGFIINEKTRIYTEHETIPSAHGEHSKIIPGKISLSGVIRESTHWSMVQMTYNYLENKFSGTLGSIYYLNHRTNIRAKLESNGQLTLGTRYFVNDNLSFVIGTSLPLTRPELFLAKDRQFSTPSGLQLEFSF